MTTEYRGIGKKVGVAIMVSAYTPAKGERRKATVIAVGKQTDMFAVDCEGEFWLIDPCEGVDTELGDILDIVFSQNPRESSMLITNVTQGVVLRSALIQRSFRTLDEARRCVASLR